MPDTGALVPITGQRAISIAPDLAELAGRAAAYGRQARSPATDKAYATDWADFEEWTDAARLVALPALPTTVGLYLAAKANVRSVATLRRRLVAIKTAHRLAGHDFDHRSPAIKDVFAGIRREKGTQQHPRRAMVSDRLREVVRKLPKTVAGARDKALLLIGFAGAFRRSELVALDVADLARVREGIAINVRRSKNDQEGKGAGVGIRRTRKVTCPVTALEAWLRVAGITEGAIFRAVNKGDRVTGERLSGRTVASIVKRLAKSTGLEEADLYSAHSMRSGWCTSASEGGADIAAIARHARHSNLETTRKYIRSAELFRNPALRAVNI